MALSAYAERMTNAASSVEHGSNPLFLAFVQAAISQLRGGYLSRTEPEQAIFHLAEAWDFLNKAVHSEPVVAVDTTATRSIFCTWMQDQPFIVDTIQLALRKSGRRHVIGFNLVVSVGRDD